MEFFSDHAPLLFPLLAAMLYSLAAIALKAANSRGIDGRITVFGCNCVMAVAFLIFYDWSVFPSLPDPLWPVVALGVLFVLGQALTVFAINCGEVSSVTPVFGVKVVIVGGLVAFVLGTPVSAFVWIGGILSAIGIACLQVRDGKTKLRGNLLAAALAFLAASSFAAFDAITQHWSPILGFGLLVPPAMIIAALLSSLLLWGRDKKAEQQREPLGLLFLGLGAAFFAAQGLVLISSIGYYGNAPSANVVYGSRGLWGILFVWLLGHWFSNTEMTGRQARVIYARVVGALLISSAIVLVFV